MMEALAGGKGVGGGVVMGKGLVMEKGEVRESLGKGERVWERGERVWERGRETLCYKDIRTHKTLC